MLYLVLGFILFFLLLILVILVVIISQPKQVVIQATQEGPQKQHGQGPAPEPRFSDAPLDSNNIWGLYNLNSYLGNLYDMDLPDYVDRDAYYSSWNRGGGSNIGSNVRSNVDSNAGSNAGSSVNLWYTATGSNVNSSNAGGFEDYTLSAFGNFGNY